MKYIQDLPGAARVLLDSERFEGVPVSLFQERLCTLWQRGKKHMNVSWFLLDESELLSFDHQFRHRSVPSQNLQFWVPHLASAFF